MSQLVIVHNRKKKEQTFGPAGALTDPSPRQTAATDRRMNTTSNFLFLFSNILLLTRQDIGTEQMNTNGIPRSRAQR